MDIYPDFNLFEKYKEKIKSGIKPFYILPCLYLTKYGTSILNDRKASIESLKKSTLRFLGKSFCI